MEVCNCNSKDKWAYRTVRITSLDENLNLLAQEDFELPHCFECFKEGVNYLA